MLCLFLNEHLKLILEVKYLEEISLDLLGLIKSLLHPLCINSSSLIFPSNIFCLSELRCDIRYLYLTLTGHLPCILQTSILGPECLLQLPQYFITILEQSKLVSRFINFLL